MDELHRLDTVLLFLFSYHKSGGKRIISNSGGVNSFGADEPLPARNDAPLRFASLRVVPSWRRLSSIFRNAMTIHPTYS